MNGQIASSLFGILLTGVFLFLFIRAVIKNELILRGAIIRGRLAAIIGVMGLMGVLAGAYLAITKFVFHIEQPPGESVAFLLVGVLFVMLLSIRFLSIFFWHPKRSTKWKPFLERENDGNKDHWKILS